MKSVMQCLQHTSAGHFHVGQMKGRAQPSSTLRKRKSNIHFICYLTSNRGIPFNQMLRMKEYPRDIMTLYSQGFSVSQYLIAYRGKKTFIKFLERAMHDGDWDAAIDEYYPFDNASDLQKNWVAWVEKEVLVLLPSKQTLSSIR